VARYMVPAKSKTGNAKRSPSIILVHGLSRKLRTCGFEFTANQLLPFYGLKARLVEFREKHIRVWVHVLESIVLICLAPTLC
jgi:hypothetical protein